MVVFKIPYPPTAAGKKQWNKQYGLNAYYSGKPWAVRKKDANYWHRLVAYEMERQGVTKEPFKNPVVVRMYFNDNLDCSNHGMMFKFIEDGMRGRILQNDSRKWVVGNEIYFHDKEYIKIEVRER